MDGTWLFKLDNHQSGPAARVRDRRLEAGHGPQRLERRRRQPAVVPGRRRLVPQGLQAARRPPSARRGWCASSRSTTARRSGSTASRSARTAAPTCPFEIRLPAGLLKRGGVNHLVIRVDSRRKQTDFPPSGPVDRGQADGRLVELRRPAARGLPAQDQRRRLQHGRRPARPPVRHVPGDGHLPRDAAQLRHAAPGASPSARASARGASPSARVAIGAKRFATLTKQIKVDKPRLWSPASPYLYDASLAVRSGGEPAAALHAEDRHPLDQGRRRPPVPQRRAR